MLGHNRCDTAAMAIPSSRLCVGWRPILTRSIPAISRTDLTAVPQSDYSLRFQPEKRDHRVSPEPPSLRLQPRSPLLERDFALECRSLAALHEAREQFGDSGLRIWNRRLRPNGCRQGRGCRATGDEHIPGQFHTQSKQRVNVVPMRRILCAADELWQAYHVVNATKKTAISHDNGGADMTIMLNANHAAKFLNRANFCMLNREKARTARSNAAPE